jgi:hypothetical protein
MTTGQTWRGGRCAVSCSWAIGQQPTLVMLLAGVNDAHHVGSGTHTRVIYDRIPHGWMAIPEKSKYECGSVWSVSGPKRRSPASRRPRES